MDEQEGFYRQIHFTPDDDAPRLIYADWLEEHGQPERAEFIRLQIEMARMRTGQISKALRSRVQELMQRKNNAAAWAKEDVAIWCGNRKEATGYAPEFFSYCPFERGFSYIPLSLSEVAALISNGEDVPPALWMPFTSRQFVDSLSWISTDIKGVRHLSLSHRHDPENGANYGLEDIDINYLLHDINSALYKEAQTLDFSHNALRGFPRQLLEGRFPPFQALRTLDLSNNNISTLQGLVPLWLPESGDEGRHKYFRQRLPALEHIDLSNQRFSHTTDVERIVRISLMRRELNSSSLPLTFTIDDRQGKELLEPRTTWIVDDERSATITANPSTSHRQNLYLQLVGAEHVKPMLEVQGDPLRYLARMTDLPQSFVLKFNKNAISQESLRDFLQTPNGARVCGLVDPSLEILEVVTSVLEEASTLPAQHPFQSLSIDPWLHNKDVLAQLEQCSKAFGSKVVSCEYYSGGALDGLPNDVVLDHFPRLVNYAFNSPSAGTSLTSFARILAHPTLERLYAIVHFYGQKEQAKEWKEFSAQMPTPSKALRHVSLELRPYREHDDKHVTELLTRLAPNLETLEVLFLKPGFAHIAKHSWTSLRSLSISRLADQWSDTMSWGTALHSLAFLPPTLIELRIPSSMLVGPNLEAALADLRTKRKGLEPLRIIIDCHFEEHETLREKLESPSDAAPDAPGAIIFEMVIDLTTLPRT
jgi:uncharacterized protein (TIGR02996 family)